MKRLILLISILVSTRAFAQYPNPLPDAGNLSIQQIASWMLAAGEISSTSNVSLASLKAASHITNKSAPHSIGDWYSYGISVTKPVGSIAISLGFINGYSNFFGKHHSGYVADGGYVKFLDNSTGKFAVIRYAGDGGPQTAKWDPYTLDSSQFTILKDNGSITVIYHDAGIDSSPSLYEFGPFITEEGDLGLFKTLVGNGDISFTVNKSVMYTGDSSGNPNLLFVKIQKR